MHNHLKLTLLLLVMTCVISINFLYRSTRSGSNRIKIETSHKSKITRHEVRQGHTNETTAILWWTKITAAELTGIIAGMKHYCPLTSCHVTRDRGELHDAAAVIFDVERLNILDLPANRSRDQSYVFLQRESPAHRPHQLQAYKDFFNLTMTYRTHSDVSLPYGKIERIAPKEDIMLEMRSLLLGKALPVAWFVSHCDTASQRELYVRELRKHIRVDIYGRCGTRECTRQKRQQCYEMLQEKYFFYLSFENSLCTDYVTEKMFNALSYGVVPVVMGAANYSEVAPPKSVVNVHDFDSPRNLATFLRKLMSNHHEYLSYLEWKTRYTSKRYYIQGAVCDLVKKTSAQGVLQWYSDIHSYWNRNVCRRAINVTN